MLKKKALINRLDCYVVSWGVNYPFHCSLFLLLLLLRKPPHDVLLCLVT